MRLALFVAISLASLALAQPPGYKQPESNKDPKPTSQNGGPKKGAAPIEEAVGKAASDARGHTSTNAQELDNELKLVEYTRQLAEYTENLATYTKWLVLATVILGIIAGLQFWQSRVSAEALPKIERAYVFPYSLKGSVGGTSTFLQDGKEVGLIDFRLDIRLRNHGRTPAVIQDVLCDVRVCKTYREAINPKTQMFRPGLVIGSGRPTDERMERFRLDLQEVNHARAGGALILYFGEIHYQDMLGQNRVTAFLREFDFDTELLARPTTGGGNRWT